MASIHKRRDSGFWYIHYRDENGKSQKLSTKRKNRSDAEKIFREWKDRNLAQSTELTDKLSSLAGYYKISAEEVLKMIVNSEYRKVFGSDLVKVS